MKAFPQRLTGPTNAQTLALQTGSAPLELREHVQRQYTKMELRMLLLKQKRNTTAHLGPQTALLGYTEDNGSRPVSLPFPQIVQTFRLRHKVLGKGINKCTQNKIKAELQVPN